MSVMNEAVFEIRMGAALRWVRGRGYMGHPTMVDADSRSGNGGETERLVNLVAMTTPWFPPSFPVVCEAERPRG